MEQSNTMDSAAADVRTTKLATGTEKSNPVESAKPNPVDSEAADDDSYTPNKEELDNNDDEDKEDSGEEELGSDLEEEIDDLVEDLAFSNIGISIGHGVPGEITMKPMLYSWLDDTGVRKLAVDFLVPSLPKDSFKPRVSKNGLYLELTVVMPDFFYNKGRLIEAFADEKGKNIVTVNHSMITAFTDSVNKIMAEPGNEDGTVLYRERHKLEFKVDHDFEFDLLIYNHDNKELRALGQFFFTFCVVLTSFVKPNKMALSSAKALTLITSPKKPSEY